MRAGRYRDRVTTSPDEPTPPERTPDPAPGADLPDPPPADAPEAPTPYASPGYPTQPAPHATQPYATQPYATQPYATQPYATQPYATQPYAPGPYPPGPTYALPPQYQADPGAPFGREPFSGIPLSDKSKVLAGLLQIFLGVFGVGRFYTGHLTLAVIMLSLTLMGIVGSFFFVGIFLVIGVQVWALVDGILLLTGRYYDSRGLLLRT